MDKKPIILGVAGLLALIVVIVVMVLTPVPEAETEPTGEPIMAVEDGSPFENATGEDEAHEEEEGDGDHDHGVAEQAEGTDAQTAAATTFLTEYIRYEHTEPKDARVARLAPLVSPDTSLASRTPALALESKWGYVGFDATVNLTSIEIASASEVNADQTLMKIDVLATYDAVYKSSAQTQARPDTKLWSIWVSVAAPHLVNSVDEPSVE